jgi:hypothetical protein
MPGRNAFTVIPSTLSTPPDASITTPKLANSAVTNQKLGPNSVTTDKILDGTIVGADIAVNSVPADRLLDGSIDPSKLGPGSIPKSKLGPLGIVDADVTGPVSGSKISTPIKQQVQFNGVAVPVETILNFLGTAGLLDIADDPANTRTNINLQGIITNQPAKGTDGQVKAVGGEPGNTVGNANTWSASNHGHQIKVIPITGQYNNRASLPFAPDIGSVADVIINRTAPGALNITPNQPGGIQFNLEATAPNGAVSQLIMVSGSPRWLWQMPGDSANSPLILYDYGLTGAVFLERARWTHNGTLQLQADAGQPVFNCQTGAGGALVVNGGVANGTNARVSSALGLELAAANGMVIPSTDNNLYLGYSGNRWNSLWAGNGVVQTSSQDFKTNIEILDGNDAIEAIRHTDAVMFDYNQPDDELPLDPDQAEEILKRKFTMAKIGHQAGFIAEQAHPLFVSGDKNSNPSNSIGILLAALKQIDERLVTNGIV